MTSSISFGGYSLKIRERRKEERELTDKILEVIAEKGEVTKYDLHKVLGLSYSRVFDTLKRLKRTDSDLIEETTGEKTRTGLYKKIYTLTPQGLIRVLRFSKLKSYLQVLNHLRRNRQAIPLSEVLDKAIEEENFDDVPWIAHVSHGIIMLRMSILETKNTGDYVENFSEFLFNDFSSHAIELENEELREMLIATTINEIKKIASKKSVKAAFLEVVDDCINDWKTAFLIFERVRTEVNPTS